MAKKRILILGAGISGLSAAWYLAKKYPDYESVIIEKDLKAGGWMNSNLDGDFLLEKGPRVFKTSRNSDFLQVVQELDFSSSLIPSASDANRRFLWLDGKFQKMPDGIFSLLFSSLCRPLLFSLFRERNVPSNHLDETIWDFASRRFGQTVAERFFDPLILGIYAGDIKKLSIDSCLPILKKWEREKGSVIKGVFSSLKNKKQKSTFKAPLFSFKEGTSSFIQKWISKIPGSIQLGEEILSLKREKGVWQARSLQNTWEGDAVVLALPSFVAAKLLKEEAPETSKLLDMISYEDITTLQMGWKGDVLPFSAFGYLVPTTEKEPVLGVLFDSKMFSKKDSLITVMIRGVFHEEKELKDIAERIRSNHLKVAEKLDLFSYKKMENAIPQYFLDHREKKNAILKSLKQEAQNLYLACNYLEGVSVNDCIKNAKNLTDILI